MKRKDQRTIDDFLEKYAAVSVGKNGTEIYLEGKWMTVKKAVQKLKLKYPQG